MTIYYHPRFQKSFKHLDYKIQIRAEERVDLETTLLTFGLALIGFMANLKTIGAFLLIVATVSYLNF